MIYTGPKKIWMKFLKKNFSFRQNNFLNGIVTARASAESYAGKAPKVNSNKSEISPLLRLFIHQYRSFFRLRLALLNSK